VEIKMKFKFKSLVVAGAFMAAGAAANADTLTLGLGESVTDQGYTVSALVGSGNLAFSKNLLDALNLAYTTVTAVDPAVATFTYEDFGGGPVYASINAAAPIVSVTGDFDGTTLNVLSALTAGGSLQTLQPDDFGMVTSGGYIAITDLRVDLVNMDVYANIDGGNGVGIVNNLKLWHIGSITGPTSFNAADVVAAGGSITVDNTLSGLKIYDDAFNVFVQAAGLINILGVPTLAGVNDSPEGYGTITSSITVKVATAAVPEPSTYALMGLGLVGLAFLRRRAAV
jgi:hypothetical protein